MKRAKLMVIALAMVAGACGGDDSANSTGIPSLEDVSGDVTTTTETSLESDEALLVFSQCMRDEGIALPDIGIDADGAPLLDPALLDVIDIESDEFTDAFEKCQPILSQSQAFNIDIDPALQAQIEDQLFVFSQCMRDNGFEDFPDPGSLGSGQPYPLTLLTQFEEPGFEEAVEVCQREIAFPGFGGGG